MYYDVEPLPPGPNDPETPSEDKKPGSLPTIAMAGIVAASVVVVVGGVAGIACVIRCRKARIVS